VPEEESRPIRVVHYINQFFAGVGGEEAADVGPEAREGAVGPALGLNQAMGDAGEVVATVFAGDNYVSAHEEQAAEQIAKLIAPFEPDVVVAGPSFGSGRYGMACGLVTKHVKQALEVPVVTAMHNQAPGAEAYRAAVPIVPTAETAVGMGPALKELARLAVKLGSGQELGSPKEDGYIPTGFRHNIFTEKTGAERAIDMLLAKVKGEAYTTEWPLPVYSKVDPPEPVEAADPILVALVTEAGVVPKGNPDRIPSGWATNWGKYDISGLEDLTPEAFETVHGGFDTSKANEDPDRLVPLDAARDLERDGRITIHPFLYSTTGNVGSLKAMTNIGNEIAQELINAGVQAAIVGAT
jgi:glycine reductase